MQLFLLGYIIISICEIFSVGLIPFGGKMGEDVRIVCFSQPLGSLLANTMPGLFCNPHWHDCRDHMGSYAQRRRWLSTD
jgi:hypothetical protein